MTVRTRFAPSPTGLLHVGGIRTALFAWLVARQANGQFILRLEDTDQKREVKGTDQHIMDCLAALRLEYDEGPDKKGPHGPYRQSQRLNIYKQWADKLIAAGRAYADPYTAEQVQSFRDQAQNSKKPFLYRNHRPENPPTWDGSTPLRLKSEPKAYKWHDEVMGDLSTGPEVIDDIILMKSDGFPTYNFAHIVDDAEMQISHIIRGQEFLSSVPNYLNIYEALGIKAPVMASMPHIMNNQGNKKLSKRDGAKDTMDYIKEGYLPEALVSFIATLGWNDGTTQEVFSVAELLQKFSLSKVQRTGARFDEKRLLWVNGHFIRAMDLPKLYDEVQAFWPEAVSNATKSYKMQVLAIVKERLKYFAELPELTHFFFTDLPLDSQLINQNKQLCKLPNEELKKLLTVSRSELENSDYSVEDLTDRLNNLLAQTDQKPAVLFSLLRIAITQAPSSPGLSDTLAVLGKAKSLERIDAQINAL